MNVKGFEWCQSPLGWEGEITRLRCVLRPYAEERLRELSRMRDAEENKQ